MLTTGNQLKAARALAGFCQIDLAERAGISVGTIRLDRVTHHVNILEMNGDSYRLAQSRARKAG